jgi:hypothetical protein
VHRDFANSPLRASAKSSEPPARLPIGVRRNTYITIVFKRQWQNETEFVTWRQRFSFLHPSDL